tara:strand:+ start:246 stop:485 length:240 start_codon:yes stop_codon:yes gene_type:complete
MSDSSTTNLALAVRVQGEWHSVEDQTEIGVQCEGCGAAFQDDNSPGLTLAEGAELMHFRCGTCKAFYPVVSVSEHKVVF